MSIKDENKKELFFPYYVNQGRLLDIYAILNDGYSEYVELTTAISAEKSKGASGEANGNGGFKLFNFGGSLSGNIEKTDTHQTENREKKIQTVTSVLSIVKTALEEKGYLNEISSVQAGQFVCLPVTLSINSIKSLLSEMSELMKLAGSMQQIGATIKVANRDTRKIDDLLRTIQVLFNGEEILYETDNFAIVGNVVDSNLYQATRSDIIGTELNCLAQVKRIFPDGTELMKNTIFTRIRDANAKEQFIAGVSSITDNNIFDFEAIAKPFIHGKPVYQLEIIALYQ